MSSGLLFIPDISGFTKFVNQVDIDHSRYIITELLENIIRSNNLGLNISEIEGDAVLFYRFGELPSAEEMYKQVETMFVNFQKQIKNYEIRRACQCQACLAAKDLSLKVITHYGEFSTYQVDKYSKLIGKDVILAHQLLKNDIDQHEYWLVTNGLYDSKEVKSNAPSWLKWNEGDKHTDEGDIHFAYSMLSPLKENVVAEELTGLEIKDKLLIASIEKIIESPAINILSLIGNFSLRPQWFEGIKAIEHVSHSINHVGVKHRAVYHDHSENFISSSFYETNGEYFYSETNEEKIREFYYSVKPLGENKTMLTISHYVNKSPLRKILAAFNKNQAEKKLLRSAERLSALAEGRQDAYLGSNNKN